MLACMDARLHPEKSLGLSIGDCHCVRNAGGRASEDALRSIAISQRLLGEGPGYSRQLCRKKHAALILHWGA